MVHNAVRIIWHFFDLPYLVTALFLECHIRAILKPPLSKHCVKVIDISLGIALNGLYLVVVALAFACIGKSKPYVVLRGEIVEYVAYAFHPLTVSAMEQGVFVLRAVLPAPFCPFLYSAKRQGLVCSVITS